MPYRVFIAFVLTLSLAACGQDPRAPDYVPQATIPLHPSPPVAAGGPRPKAPPPEKEASPKEPSKEEPKQPESK